MFRVLLETGLLIHGPVLVRGIRRNLAEFSGIIFHFILVSFVDLQVIFYCVLYEANRLESEAVNEKAETQIPRTK